MNEINKQLTHTLCYSYAQLDSICIIEICEKSQKCTRTGMHTRVQYPGIALPVCICMYVLCIRCVYLIECVRKPGYIGYPRSVRLVPRVRQYFGTRTRARVQVCILFILIPISSGERRPIKPRLHFARVQEINRIPDKSERRKQIS